MNFLYRHFIITGIFPILLLLLGCAGPGISYIHNNSSINDVGKDAQNNDLKVMTANISLSVRYIPSTGDYAYQDINDQKMVAISDVIESFDPDIVALQKVGGFSQAEFLAKQFDLNFVYISHHRPAKGFAILSKHLISDVKNEGILPYRKGMVSTIIINGLNINFINVHYGPESYNSQAETTMQVVQSLSNPVILLGGFNIKEGDYVMEPINNTFLDTTTFMSMDDKERRPDSGRIDYIFVDQSKFRVKWAGLVAFENITTTNFFVNFAVLNILD